MYKRLFNRKQKEECNCEKYFLDSFDKEHLYFVALGITTMENYAEMKRQYYEKRIYKISQ